METAPLKSFATWARTALIREVGARIATVLAPGSSERVEQAKAVAALERAIAAAGGGDKGRSAVADRVAYTWFNRIIALRFMDANGYTGVGVVSPQPGVAAGQPEVLGDAKRGTLDALVVSAKTREIITGLLDGSRRSGDPQGEAYALLLADYCRHWNRAMPFMFEREGDFTELLMPANLLADDSVLNRAAEVLTAEVCQDVEVIGWLYQFYISERKDEVFAGFKKNKKAGADEIPAATQLFTPHWIVRYLVENSLGRLWMLNRPGSRLIDQMDYYIAPVDTETDFPKITSPQELTIIDPACGSGHMLTYAFDLLYAMYEEEGYAAAEIPSLILANNLYGVEIDPRAGALAAFALTMKARARQRTFLKERVEPNVCALEPMYFPPLELETLMTPGGDRHEENAFWNQFENADTFGSLIRPDTAVASHLARHVANLSDRGDLLVAATIHRARRVLLQASYLAPRFAVVVANPPYMGSKQMGSLLREYIEGTWNSAKNDFATGFMAAGLALRMQGGLVAMVCPQSWMFLSRYEEFRSEVMATAPPLTLAHLGARAFPELAGEVVQVAAFVLGNGSRDEKPVTGSFLRLVDFPDAPAKERALRAAAGTISSPYRYDRSLAHVRAIPGSPVAYWASEQILGAFREGQPLGDVAPTRKGMVTARNEEFLRLWFEVSSANCALDSCSSREEAQLSGKRWFAYIKGGPARRWYGNYSYVVDWANDGHRLQTERHPTENRVWATNFNLEFTFRPNINWGDISGAGLTARWSDGGMLFDGKGPACFPPADRALEILALLNSPVAAEVLNLLNPTLNFLVGDVARIPLLPVDRERVARLAAEAVDLARDDWDSQELSWGFSRLPVLVTRTKSTSIGDAFATFSSRRDRESARLSEIEDELATVFSDAYGIHQPVIAGAERAPRSESEGIRQLVSDLVSYFVGCVFGRYSLDGPGLVLADQGATVSDYLSTVPAPTFPPDRDNVIPIVDGDWFEDDIVARFREFLRVAFGEQHFEESLRFVTESLGVHDIRDYFVKAFYKDHVQRYKKRPIYWLFSSPKGSFNALIYMHRYTPSTVSTVLNEYLREFSAKLAASLAQQERLAAGGATPRQQAAAQKDADRLRKVLLELAEYEHEVLYPLASRQLAIDLDDGVKVNYPKFGAALKKIPGLEASDE